MDFDAVITKEIQKSFKRHIKATLGNYRPIYATYIETGTRARSWTGHVVAPQKPSKKRCFYCGTEIMTTGKCPHCNGPIFEKPALKQESRPETQNDKDTLAYMVAVILTVLITGGIAVLLTYILFLFGI